MPRTIVNVCSNWNGIKGEQITFQNSNSNDCTISSQTGQTWPFAQSSPITVPARTASGPGQVNCDLLSNLGDGTYPYDVDGCPNLKLTVSSKSVTIP